MTRANLVSANAALHIDHNPTAHIPSSFNRPVTIQPPMSKDEAPGNALGNFVFL
jgi:hypothetical protein